MCIVTCTKLQATAHGIAGRTSWPCPAQADAGELGMDQPRTLRRMPQGSRGPLLRTLASRCMRACCGRADHAPRRPPRASRAGCRECAAGELRRQGHSTPSRGHERATPGAAPRRGREEAARWTEPGRGSAPRRGRGWATTTSPEARAGVVRDASSRRALVTPCRARRPSRGRAPAPGRARTPAAPRHGASRVSRGNRGHAGAGARCARRRRREGERGREGGVHLDGVDEFRASSKSAARLLLARRRAGENLGKEQGRERKSFPLGFGRRGCGSCGGSCARVVGNARAHCPVGPARRGKGERGRGKSWLGRAKGATVARPRGRAPSWPTTRGRGGGEEGQVGPRAGESAQERGEGVFYLFFLF
jgi:hypothetical protein